MPEEPLIDTAEVARRLGVSESAVRGWARERKIRSAFRTPGGRFRFRWSEVEEDLRNLDDARERPEE
ncbi:MAG: helix-turn-helix domain-containing protein [Pseudonocardia sp.]|nr:helix-turn-helix domain-containing protein [Pseudonocardia sp.]